MSDDPRSQADKFADLARKLECDDDAAAFDERLTRLAGSEPRPAGTWSIQMAKVGNGYIAWFTPDDLSADMKSEGPHFETEAEALAWMAEQ